MNLRTFNIYDDRRPEEGVRIATVRHLPRGLRKEDRKFDVWLPILAPSVGLLNTLKEKGSATPAFFRRYRAEMKKPDPRHVIELLAAIAVKTRVSIGCHCQDKSQCHRSVLEELIRGAGNDE